MNTTKDMAMKFGLIHELIKPALVSKVIAKTRTKMEVLRDFCARQMMFVNLQRWKDKDGSDESENEYEPQDNNSEEFPHIMRSDAKTVFQVCSKANDFTFLNAFLY